ncbi:Purple acid phosphatase [Aphelenchoides fujianensis]|nr:Purple acid phosphatase [Aphelenchoides fujianensis]
MAARPQLRADRVLGWQSENKNKGPYRGQPEGVHLAYGGKPNLISITWTTFDDVGNSSVEYGENGRFDRSATAAVSEFVDGGAKQSVRFIHRALIKDVQAGHRYNYRVGSEHGWSSVFSFVGLEERKGRRLQVRSIHKHFLRYPLDCRIACFGDLGNINARSLGKLQRMSQDGDFDMVIHNGDFAFDLGLTHFVAINTEFYYFNGRDEIQTQWNWLVDDLKVLAEFHCSKTHFFSLQKANANRNNVPWIVLYMHRSMYCSDVEGQCGTRELILRQVELESPHFCPLIVCSEGLDWSGTFGLEKLIYESGVDLVIGAHEHSRPYEDPPAPVLLIVGSAGCQEETNHYKDPPAWSAFRSSNYGFGLLQVFNRTHLHYEQVKASEVRTELEDEMWLVQTEHRTRTAADLERLKREGVYMKPSNFP